MNVPDRPSRPQPRPAPRPGLMRNLGQFFGHIVKGVTSDPGPGPEGAAAPNTSTAPPPHTPPPAPAAPNALTPARVVARAESVEHALPGPDGGPSGVVLRRTVIDEVEFRPSPEPGPTPTPPDAPSPRGA